MWERVAWCYRNRRQVHQHFQDSTLRPVLHWGPEKYCPFFCPQKPWVEGALELPSDLKILNDLPALLAPQLTQGMSWVWTVPWWRDKEGATRSSSQQGGWDPTGCDRQKGVSDPEGILGCIGRRSGWPGTKEETDGERRAQLTCSIHVN